MAHRCPDCGHINDDSRIFCASCGEALDSELRLIQAIKKEAKRTSHDPFPRQGGAYQNTVHRNDDLDNDEDDYVYIPRKTTQK